MRCKNHEKSSATFYTSILFLLPPLVFIISSSVIKTQYVKYCTREYWQSGKHCVSFMDLFPCISGREDQRNKERGKEAKVVAVYTESEGRRH